MSFAHNHKHTCARPGCEKPTPGDALYCSTECYDADNDPNPVVLLAETDPAYVARKWAAQNKTPARPLRITRSSKERDCE